MLKRIDSSSIYKGLEDETNKLLSIRKYYTNLEEELQNEKYSNSGFDFGKVFNEIEMVFETCMFWDNIETALNSDNEEGSLFKQYFELEGRYYFKETVFMDVYNLKQALEILNEFYESKRNSSRIQNHFHYILVCHGSVINLVSLVINSSFLVRIRYENFIRREPFYGNTKRVITTNY